MVSFHFQGLGFGVVDKIFLKFPHRWWPDNYTNFGFLWPHDDACNLNSVSDNTTMEKIIENCLLYIAELVK